MLLIMLFACSDYKVHQLEPKLSVTPTVLDFAGVAIGQTANADVVVVNSGDAPLHLTDPVWTIEGAGAINAELAEMDIAPGASTLLSVYYTPAAERADAGSITVADTGSLSAEILWSGEGVAGSLQVSPESLDFGSLLSGTSAEQILALSNSGLAPITVSALDVSGDAGFTVSPLTQSLPLVIDAGDTAVLQAMYTADTILPAFSTLSIQSDDLHHNPLTVSMSANTEAPNNRPVISLLSPGDGDTLSLGQNYTLRAFALDVETPPELLTVRFESTLQGVLGEVHPDPSGEVLLPALALLLGNDTITATVVDGDGSSNADTAAITVTDCMELSWDRSETFDSTFDDSLFAINGSATVDSATEELWLTDSVAWTAGAIYLREPILLQRFYVDLDFRIDLGTGADGLAIVAATGASPGDMLGRTGEQLGVGAISGVTGFVIEVDVHSNGSRGDPAGDHIALVSLPDYAHITTPVEVAELENSVSHHLTVDFNEGLVEVTLDGTLMMSEIVPDWVEFEGYLGVTAATGALYNRHVLERWDVQTGCW